MCNCLANSHRTSCLWLCLATKLSIVRANEQGLSVKVDFHTLTKRKEKREKRKVWIDVVKEEVSLSLALSKNCSSNNVKTKGLRSTETIKTHQHQQTFLQRPPLKSNLSDRIYWVWRSNRGRSCWIILIEQNEEDVYHNNEAELFSITTCSSQLKMQNNSNPPILAWTGCGKGGLQTVVKPGAETELQQCQCDLHLRCLWSAAGILDSSAWFCIFCSDVIQSKRGCCCCWM